MSSLGDDFSEYNAGRRKRVVDYLRSPGADFPSPFCEVRISQQCASIRCGEAIFLHEGAQTCEPVGICQYFFLKLVGQPVPVFPAERMKGRRNTDQSQSKGTISCCLRPNSARSATARTAARRDKDRLWISSSKPLPAWAKLQSSNLPCRALSRLRCLTRVTKESIESAANSKGHGLKTYIRFGDMELYSARCCFQI